MRTLTTESGSTYRVDGTRIQRVNPGYTKRADGDWVELIRLLPEESMVGHPLQLILRSLSDYGPDDEGVIIRDAPFTFRTTSAVTSDVEES